MPFLAPIAAGLGSLGAAAGSAGGVSAIAGAASGVAGLIGGAGGGNIQNAGQRLQLQNLADTQGLVNSGPGASDVSAGAQAQRAYADQLQAAGQQGGLDPNQQDIAGANQLSGQLFRQRQVGLEQNFLQQNQQFQQQAALQGRNPLDPVFRNKLAQEQTQQQERLQADQSTFATQRALQQPEQRLQFQQQRASVLQGLASQALSNRQALSAMGAQAADIKAEGQGAGGIFGSVGGALQGIKGGLGAGQQINKLFADPFGRRQAGEIVMAEQGFKDFLAALSDFKSGLQDFNRTRVIDQANEQVQAIRSSEEGEAKKRAALQNISNQLVGQLAGNTPATTIEQIKSAFGPTTLASPAAAIQEGIFTGNEELSQLGARAATEQRAVKEGLAEEFKAKESALNRNAMLKAAGIKVEAKDEQQSKRLDNKSRDELSANFSVLDAIQDLNGEVSKLGDAARIAGGFGGARASAQLARTRSKAEALKVQIARAAESGVLSDQDLKRYNDILGGLGDFKTLSAFKAGYEAFAFKSGNIIKNRLETLKGEGKNVSAHEKRLVRYDVLKNQDPDLAKLPPGSQFLGNRVINGLLYKEFQLPDGTRKKKRIN